MNDFKQANGSRFAGTLGRLHEANVLHTRIKGLKALLEIQRRQFEELNDRLPSGMPGRVAARRLRDLKRSEER